MIQLFVIFSFFAWIISLLGWGFLANYPVKKYFKGFEVADEFMILYHGTLGLMILSVIGTLFNFFVPLDEVFSIIVLIIGLVLFFSYKKNILNFSRGSIVLVLLIFIYSAIFSLLKLKNYDTGLYHLSMINWITNSALPFGLANLHSRFGFNSAWFIDASIIYPLRMITKSPFFIIDAIIFFFYGTFIFLILKRMIKENEIRISSIFALTTFVPWFYYLEYMISSPSPDVPTMLLTFFVTFLLIRTFETKKYDYFFISLFISFYIVTIKLSAAPYFAMIFLILFLLFIFEKQLGEKGYKIVEKLTILKYITASAILMLVGVPYLMRGIVSSGYVAFPATVGRLNVEWRVPTDTTVDTANWVKSWARKPLADWHEVLGNWNWLNPWFFNLFSNYRFLALTLAIGIFVAVACIFLKKKKELANFLIVASLALVGCLFWFFTAPDPRFGYGYLCSFFGILISYGVYNFVSSKDGKKRFLGATCIFIFLIVFWHIYNKNINPKEIFNTNKIQKTKFVEMKTDSGGVVYVPSTGDQCFDGPLLCTPYFNKDLRITFDKDNNPKMFWVEQ